MFCVKHVAAFYEKQQVLKDISLTIQEKEFVCILGANGCGKTTLLKIMLGLKSPQTGEILLDGQSVKRFSEKELAKKVAYVPQAHVPPFPYKVADVVLMGRTPYVAPWREPSKEDEAYCCQLLEELGIADLAEKEYTELSGGQRQLVIIARALAQQPAYLLMDEPTAGLDFGNQYLVLSRLAEYTKKSVGIIMVTHDPGHAVFCANRIVAIKDGLILKDGSVQEVLTDELLTSIYHVPVSVQTIELTKHQTHTVCIPMLEIVDKSLKRF